MSNYQLVLTTHAVNQEAANYQHRYKNVSQHKNSTQKVQKGLGFLPLCPALTISFMLFECNVVLKPIKWQYLVLRKHVIM